MIEIKEKIFVDGINFNEALLSLFIASIARSEIIMEDQLNITMGYKYGENISEEDREKEFKKLNDRFVTKELDLLVELQYKFPKKELEKNPNQPNVIDLPMLQKQITDLTNLASSLFNKSQNEK